MEAPLFKSLLNAAAEHGLEFDDPVPPRSRYCEVDGLRLHHLDWGVADKPAMLLLHGIAVSAHSWDFFSLAMRRHFHVRALDHRGHGDSEWAPDKDYRRERMAEDVVELAARLELVPLVLVGHSMGGAVALLSAARMPETVKAMVIVDSTLGPRPGRNRIQRFMQGPDTFDSIEDLARHATRFNPRRDLDQLIGSLRLRVKELPDGRWTWKYDSYLRDPNQSRPPPDFKAIWEAIENLSCPMLVVRASDRSHISDDLVPRLEALAPRVRLVTVPRSGHSVMGDNPPVFETEVTRFLQEVEAIPAAQRATGGVRD